MKNQDIRGIYSRAQTCKIITMLASLQPRTANGGQVEPTGPRSWRLSLPGGAGGMYRWAQLDDHLHRARRDFPIRPPARMELRARVSADDLPGTWGFGWWNDPFSLSFGVSGAARRFPALPQAAWFFYASPPNHLALRDNHPAQGLLAATFKSARIPTPLLALGAPALPLLLFPATTRLVRRLTRLLITDAAARLDLDATVWHEYRIDWQEDQVEFQIDGDPVAAQASAPAGPLGFVLWIDNQYAAFPPSGRLKMGTLANPEMWMEVEFL